MREYVPAQLFKTAMTHLLKLSSSSFSWRGVPVWMLDVVGMIELAARVG